MTFYSDARLSNSFFLPQHYYLIVKWSRAIRVSYNTYANIGVLLSLTAVPFVSSSTTRQIADWAYKLYKSGSVAESTLSASTGRIGKWYLINKTIVYIYIPSHNRRWISYIGFCGLSLSRLLRDSWDITRTEANKLPRFRKREFLSSPSNSVIAQR